MPDNSPRGARLDHVSDAGDLVFEAGGERFIVTVDEALERALLEAKQIRSESLKQRQVRPADTLPISQIQQLIRAGADPAKVAQRYGLAEALVRRFSASVQTEKQYAIEQFKRVPAPKESRLHTVEEVIDMTLLAARVDRGTLSWSATRRNHEPWHIVARFLSAGRKVHAEWTWDMHDNTVVCLNAAARKLLGEQSLGAGTPKPVTPSAAEARANVGLPAMDVKESFPVDLGPSSPAPGTAPVPAPAAAGAGEPASPDGAVLPTTTDDIPVFRPNVEIPAPDGSLMSNSPVVQPASSDGEATDLAAVADLEPADDEEQGGRDAAAGHEADAKSPRDAKPRTERTEAAKRRAGRSAVPSWDEILFGE
ncbi:septation protein SepH [Bifidobacterium platyrrhinorum]|uniref:DUF3071 domain-containing protein n=1 Tax=Bifidobacterium platyrrhinorum TaxID=2661628 RepID=A0A6L9SRV4_9BIFI|nr:septation protein SepH [Bifidobacterium platyrrhinorum]NEG54503.1 DUF3071 domain-containing protein [Bifidobacterium platyrrhinorum]